MQQVDIALPKRVFSGSESLGHYSHKEKEMRLVSFNEEGLVFDNGTILTAYHSQDCCEVVYADFNQLRDTDILDHEFNDLSIEDVPDAGFRLEGYFVPCYNEQNGYYSSNLTVKVKDQTGKMLKKVDVSKKDL